MECDCPFVDTDVLRLSCGAGFALFMAMVEGILQRRCDVADPCGRAGRDSAGLGDGERFDAVVVGAGVAGSVVAARLAELRDWRVLLLEAGPEEPTATQLPCFAVSAVGGPVDWNYTTVPQRDACLHRGGVCKWPRGKMVAGTGGMNGMMYTRGHRAVFDEWAALGNEGWAYEDVLPYFKKSEKNLDRKEVDEEFHGFEGPLVVQHFPHQPDLADTVLRAAKALGYRLGDLNGANQTGFNVAQMMVADGLRGSTSRMFLRPAARKPNLRVAINARVTKVLVDPVTRVATGVQFIDSAGKLKTALAAREVVLSAGAIGSPQILLLSGIGPREDLRTLGIPVVADLPVGRNLHNHISVGVGFYMNDTAHQMLTDSSLTHFLQTRKGPMTSTGLTQTTGFLKSKFAVDGVPDLQVFFDGYSARCSRTGSLGECTSSNIPDGEPCGQRFIHSRPTNVRVRSKGVLRLRSTDPMDAPLMDPRYLSDPRDLDVLLEGIRAVVAMSRTEPMRAKGFRLDESPKAGCEALAFGSDEYWRCVVRHHTGAENHQAGTCAMGPHGVLDARLRVRGLRQLRVADASIFPDNPNSNPVAAIIMVAEKAADMIKQDWKPKFVPWHSLLLTKSR